MKSKHIAADTEAQVHVIILDSGEEAFAALTRFVGEPGISAASLTAIGAFERATVGWFDIASKSYRKIEVNEQCEVLSAIGDVAVGDDGKAKPSCPHRARPFRWLDPRRPPAGGHGEADARGGFDRSPGDASTKEEGGSRDRADRS